ncbi:MAG: S8 family serine peptidase [Chloroflexota bacterium]|nr:S8 family serine peptidase [Chloroflexota bacterium]
MTRKGVLFFVLMVSLVLALASPILAADRSQETAWQSKVDPWVMDKASESKTEFLVFLSQQADFGPAAALQSKDEKGRFVHQTLTALAEETQRPVIEELDRLAVDHRSYWVANMIWVNGGMEIVEAMARRADVAHIYANPTVQMEGPVSQGQPQSKEPEGIEWNISLVGAPDVWSAGFAGQGAVVAGQDTGYDWDHPALINQYRGWNGAIADHDYSWHDAIHSGGGSCGADSPFPCDDSQHGTHTMGTMVGDDGGSNQVGMAPLARWIGCRNMDQGNGTPATYSECYQWFIAPTRIDGSDPDPTMAPDVINNSWSCPPSEGCTDPNALLTVVDNVRAAGIVTAHSAGNSGPGCSSVSTPSAIYDSSFTVGATTSSDSIASFSSRGPVLVDGSNRLKPDISAPGQSIRSTVPGGGYGSGWSGTSMASPHVAGLVALVLSVRPDWSGNVHQLESVIEQNAVHLTSTQTCGGVPGNNIPNNTFGYGRIDAFATFLASQVPTAVTLSGLDADQSNPALPIALPGIALPATVLASLATTILLSRRRGKHESR